MPSRQPRRPEHRVHLLQAVARSAGASAGAIFSSRGERLDLRGSLGQELVQRRVEQPDGDRVALHGAEDGLEVAALHRQQLGQRPLPPGRVLGDDHLPHGDEPVAVEEHVLGAAEADALGAEVAAPVRVGRRVGVHPHPELPDPVGPLHQPVEVAAQLRAR